MKQKRFASEKFLMVVSILALITGAAALALAGYLRVDANRSAESTVQTIVELNNELTNLKTCYDNNLKPCTSEVVRAYNAQHGLYPQ